MEEVDTDDIGTAGFEIDDFEAWYRREHPKVVSTIAAVTGRPSMAGEIADEAFTRACERWARVRAMESPGGWVTRTALNVARRRLRRTGHERRLLVSMTSTAPAEASPPAWSPEMWDALARLPRREREAIVLRYVADLPVAEVAAAMGIAAGSVTSSLHAARRRLAHALDPTLEAGDRSSSGPSDDHEETTDAHR